MAKYAKHKNTQLGGAMSANELPKGDDPDKEVDDQIPNGAAADDNKSEGAEPNQLRGSTEGLSELKSINSDRQRALSEMRKNPPPPYIEEKAVELRRIKTTSFRNEFFDTM